MDELNSKSTPTDTTECQCDCGAFKGWTGVSFGMATLSWIVLLSFSWIGLGFAILSFIISVSTLGTADKQRRPVHYAAIGLSLIFTAVCFIAPGIWKVIWG